MVLPTMSAKVVHSMRVEYQKWPYKNFYSNFRALQKKIESELLRSRQDCEAYGHDRAIYESKQAGMLLAIPWHRSKAKEFLVQDIKNGKIAQMSPKELYASRVEYQEFTLKKFRNHIYQVKEAEAKREKRFQKKKLRQVYHPLYPEPQVVDS